MANSELYLIFPAYEDAQGKPHYIKTVGLLSEEDYVVFLSNIESLILFFELENYEGYYDGTNIQAFLLPLDTVEEYYPNIKTRFRRIMSDWGENWRKQSVQAEDDNYQYFSTEITNDTLCELTKRIKDSTDENTYLLINQDAFSCSESMIRTKCNDIVYEIDVRTIGVKNIANWFETNRVPQRIYNWNPKHGENGKGAHFSNKGDKVSRLMCSRGEAAILLKKALGDELKTLYFFDETHKQYIEFKEESENTYHAFHLDKENETRVSDKVKKNIKKVL